jgi:hypothetical protein
MRRLLVLLVGMLLLGLVAFALATPENAASTPPRVVVVRQRDEVVLLRTRIACFVERNVDPPNQPVGLECGKGFVKGSWEGKSYGVTIRINDEVELFQIDSFAQIPGTVFAHGQVPWPRIGVAGQGGRLIRITVGDAIRLRGSDLVCNLRLLDVGAPHTPTLLCEVLSNGRPPSRGSWAVSISDQLVSAVRFGRNQQITASRAFRQP